MSIELRILSGVRAGQSQSFEKPVITIGRNPASDLRFDATGDLDVSTNHGEIRGENGRYTVHDNASTNGTFVNGSRIPSGGKDELRDGDVVGFGAHGPTVSVRIAGGRGTPVGERITSKIDSDAVPRRPTTERVAIAVSEQTRRLRVTIAVTVVVLGALVVGAYWFGHRAVAAPAASAAGVAGATATPLSTGVTGVMTMPAVRDANDAAIVLITTDLAGKSFEATGFSVSTSGLIVTNRHVVDDGGTKASRITVTFANTKARLPAHIVRLDSDVDVDLALIQVDAPATYPVVRGIARTVDTPVGGAIATLGFPLGTDVQMGASGGDLVPETSLTMGSVSKRSSNLLQIDSFASHGSSGSPVFDVHGHVIGAVWGGPRNAAGRIVYAVPADRIFELVNGGGGGGNGAVK